MARREDPHKHLKGFHVVCAGMKPHGITDEQLYLRAFPFSLKDKAKDWLYYLPSGSIETWADMKQQFLQRFFQHLEQLTFGRKFTESDSPMGSHYMSIGRGSRCSLLATHIISSPNHF
ncbi:UNVERIFIED_CONTAM: hypothetical protein Slati_4221300 [Sesamum latifolium]|uniref:Retrotransposon gag domain-containing protein n=1 Tax=Sesamum latifolium TaxID=2727402 RepID=A0AAW2TBU0_9LAMI